MSGCDRKTTLGLKPRGGGDVLELAGELVWDIGEVGRERMVWGE